VISVIVPTIDGREEYLKDCLASYAAHTSDYEVIVVPNKPNCGLAWTEGADLAVGSDYFTLALTTYSHTQAGLRRQWKLWNEGFSPRHESSTQTGAYKAVEGKRRGSESNLLGPEPASRESRSYRDSNGSEYDYWYSRF
jgi:hypothetical protein